MGPLIEDDRFTDADAALIRRKAMRLVGSYGYKRQDVPDLEQELALHVVLRSSHYDPARGNRDAFVATIAKRKLLNLIASRMAKKRRGGLGVGAVHERRAKRDLDLRLDVAEVLARLPDDVRHVAVLRRDHTVDEVGRRLGMSRQQVRGRVGLARDAFHRADLAPFTTTSKNVNQSVEQPGNYRWRRQCA